MPSRSERDLRLYVEDMVAFCDAVLEYTNGLDDAQFLAERMRVDATLRNLMLIGEAATKVPEALRAMAPKVPWRKLVGTRNRLIHAYLGIDLSTIWSIVQDDVPVLRKELVDLLARLPD